MSHDPSIAKLSDVTVKDIEIARLLLDRFNPRLSNELQGSDDQTELAINMAEIFDSLAVARSIARFGFYPWETCVVVPDDDRYIVVEGNRRLTAVRGLMEPALRSQFDNAEAWNAAAKELKGRVFTSIPCVAVSTRNEAVPALGYRHISGIKPWEPQMQARFVASLVDADGRSFEEVAELTGQTRLWVQETYSTFKVLETADQVGVDTTPAAEAYSLLTVAMSTRELRDHIGAERLIPEQGVAIKSPEPSKLTEMFSWIFGSDNSEPVASESREIRSLAKVVAKPAGLRAIREGVSLEEAKQRAEDSEYDPRDVIRRDLARAEQMLIRVSLESVVVDDTISGLVDGIVEQAQRLVNEIDSEGE